MDSILVSAIQMTSVSDKEANRKKVAHFVEKACKQKAKLIVLPEHWNWLGKSLEKKGSVEQADGESFQFLKKLAKQHQCAIIAGSINEKNGDKLPYNSSCLIRPDGNLGKIYRKIHLFDSNLPGHLKESDFTSAGHELVVEDCGWCKIGFSICYDIRFPELYRKLADRGAQILAIPSNFTSETGLSHWEVLVRARAIENQCFVIAADQTGVTGAGWEAHGHSMIVDPWGKILAMAQKEETALLAELKLDLLLEVRKKIPISRFF